MSKVWTVRTEGLSKKFGRTLRSAMKYGLVDCGKHLVGMPAHPDVLRSDEFWALDDIEFELEQGVALGVMGVNGSGKTTLLRILNGTFAPDRGRARVRGRVGALIAAGAGFSPMLTGRENIYVNGALVGMRPKEIDAKLEEIVEFAQLAEFLDMPVRNYSSGMSVRLGFSVAVMSHPEVLLIDEVLAVGDLSFQKKCFDKFREFQKQGKTMVLATHSMDTIEELATKTLYLDSGRQAYLGDSKEAIRRFNKDLDQRVN